MLAIYSPFVQEKAMEAYLSFAGNCAEAFAFWGQALGGQTTFSMSFGDSPMGGQTPAEYKDKVMHATFEARGDKIMGSDMPPGMVHKGYEGFSLSVQATDVEEGRRLFDALAEGGQVTMHYGPQFWAKGFGILQDRFGVSWMVNCDS